MLWHPLRVNHYVIKSWEEFETRKRPRGRATRPGLYRDAAFFELHDCNEIADPMPDWLLAAAAAEAARLRARLAALPARAAEPAEPARPGPAAAAAGRPSVLEQGLAVAAQQVGPDEEAAASAIAST